MPERLSYLEVDTAIAEGDAHTLDTLRGDPEWDAHLAATTAPRDIPDWVVAISRREERRNPTRRRWYTATALLMAALALLVLWPGQPYVGEKGSASALLYVERGGEVTVWDGQRALTAGERFRIEVADLGAPWFVIVYEEPGEDPVVLATGEGEGLIDGAWTFDAPAAGSRLLVIGLGADPAEMTTEAVLKQRAVVTLSLR